MYKAKDVIKVFSKSVAYDWDKKSSLIEKIQGDDNLFFNIFSKYGKDGSKILEVGCGTGKLIKKIDGLYNDISIDLIEPSEDMCMSVSAKTFNNKIRVINKPIEEVVFIEKYDLILLKQVLHHIADKKSILRKLKGVLSDNGVIIMMFPNEKYQSSLIPFERNDDLLGRIDKEMLNTYIEDLDLTIDYLESMSNKAYFDNIYNYLRFMYSIGSLQKLFSYRKESYISVLELINIYKGLFVNSGSVEVEFGYCYTVLKK